MLLTMYHKVDGYIIKNANIIEARYAFIQSGLISDINGVKYTLLKVKC